MICPECRHENREGAKFCEQCGTALARQCPSCRRPVRPGARFCDSCGQPLDAVASAAAAQTPLEEAAERVARKLPGYTPRYLAEKILTSRAALVGERKQVTVLFADVAGFTALSTRIDPEALHEIMDGCFRHLMDAVHRYEGTVNQFTGDGVMALFGAPIAHEDHAVRAVAAALAVQKALLSFGERLRNERGIDFAVRIGLNTGPVVVGKIGDDLRMDYTAQGETVNLAARLQQAAPPGGAVVGETTHARVSGYFLMEPLGRLTLKGVPEPVPAWLVTGQRSGRGRFDLSLERGLSPLVGRDRELAFLEDSAARALDGRGQVVSIVGAAGMGKTRLAYELRRRLEGSRFAALRTACQPHGEALPFEVVTRFLETGFRFGESESDPERGAKIESAVRALDPALEWTLPYLRHLVGLPAPELDAEGLDSVQRRRRTIDAVKAYFLCSAAARPLFLLVDDLQWLDAGSEECLRAVVDAVPSHPVLLVCTCREGYAPAWDTRSFHRRITLDPLGPTDSAHIVAHVLGTANPPAPVRNLVCRRAEGNPLFLEELTAFLVQRGLLDRLTSGSPRERELAESELPATVRDLLAARIDRLADPEKATLQIAAVLGREFSLRLLEATNPPHEELASRVAELVRLELLREKELVPEIRLSFTHAMLQQVAYEGLLVSARADLHRRAGEALERLYPERLDEVLPELARHYGRGNEPARAFRYLVRAGDRAASLFAYAEADFWYRQALEAADRCAESDRALVCERIADAAYASGEVGAALDQWREALKTVAKRPDRRHTADLHRKIGCALWAAAERNAALEQLESGLVALGDERNVLEAARIHQELARIHFRLGEHERAVAEAERALELGRRHEAPDVVSHAYNTLGLALARSGDIESGIERVERSLDTAQVAGLASAACRAYGNLAILCMTVDHRRSIAYGQQGLELARRIGDQMQQSWLACALAAGHCSLGGDYDAGVRAAEEAIEMDRRLGQRSHLPIPLILLAQIHQCRGEVEPSRRYYLDALEIAEAVGEPQLLVPCYEGLATLALEAEDEPEADEWLDKSRRIQEATGWSSDVSLLLPFVS